MVDQLWDKWVKYVKPTKLDIADVLGDQQCDLMYLYLIIVILSYLFIHFYVGTPPKL